MKFLLVLFCVFPSLCLAAGEERRLTTLTRDGSGPEWDNQKSEFAQIFKNLTLQGSLRMARTSPIESIHPYDREDGRRAERPNVIDDLYYETLFLNDPLGSSEVRYPLLADAVRLPADNSYAVIELNSRARFQDGTPVTAGDVVASIEILKASAPEVRQRIDAGVRSLIATGSELRVEFTTTGQASLNTLLLLAGTKIVKQNTTGATSVGGIKVRFTVTGPYRLAQLGRSRLSLIIDPSYWGRSLGVRRGFFNLRAVDVVAYPDEVSARMSVADESANFLLEHQPAAVMATHKMLRAKNQGIVLVQEPAKPEGAKIPSLSFNLKSPQIADPRIRQAILLAYDFDGINSMQYAGGMQRPLGLLDGSRLHPKSSPSETVRAMMAACQVNEPGAIETQGHGQYASIEDKRMRLLTAMRLLQDAGLKIENGFFKRPLADGTFEPLRLRLLVRERELRAANFFRADLQRLGIMSQVTALDGEALRVQRSRGDFELVSTEEGFLDKDGWPSPDRLMLGESQCLPCLENARRILQTENPRSQPYLDAAEAIARLHEALTMSIFTGSPTQNNFFHDGRLNLPSNLSADGMHLYGYWLDHEPPENVPHWFPGFNYWPGGCADLACLFEHAR